MKWSPQQEDALKAVDKWFNDPNAPQVFHLFGFAGTGKTTLARHLAEGIHGLVLFGAFTGKASFVLKTKGCPGAQTIHSMIYKSREKGKSYLIQLEKQLEELIKILSDEGQTNLAIQENAKIKQLKKLIKAEVDGISKPNFILNLDSIVRDAVLVVIDECSMVDETMGRDLLSFKKKVLVLGDPAQLPPVGGAGFFTENVVPDILLTEIHRQAAESPIIRLATMTRKKQSFDFGNYAGGDSETGEESIVRVIRRRDVNPKEVIEADQLLVGRNATRFSCNKRMRQLLNIGDPLPVNTDKIVCLRNNKDEDIQVLNGELFFISEVHEKMDDKVLATIASEYDGSLQQILMHEHHFLGPERAKELKWFEKKDANEFDYGYALTVHKSQGSQWDNLMLFDESEAFRTDWHRWLYTGITRAAENMIIARD